MKKILMMVAVIQLAVLPMNAQKGVMGVLAQLGNQQDPQQEQVQQEAQQPAEVVPENPAADLPAGASFEGEIVYETFENYSDYILKMGNSIYFNGVHKIRLIIKNNWMHMIDETTGCHIIVNDAKAQAIMAKLNKKNNISLATLAESRSNNSYSYVHFCDHTKSGLDMSDAPGTQYFLSPEETSYATGQKAPIVTNTFAKTEEAKNIMDQDCPLYAGQIVRDMGGMNQTYDVKAWVNESLVAPAGYKWNLYGLDIPAIALKWVMRYDGGHISMANVGELSYYIEADVTSITPRPVDDSEFDIPAGYKIKAGGSSDAFKMMSYYNGVRKELVKRGIKGGDNSQKTSGVHYKTDGEWDF